MRVPFAAFSLLLAASNAYSAGTEFDLPDAMAVAGTQVPANVETYSFFYIRAEEGLMKEADELARRLPSAAAEKEFVGLAGPRPDLTRTVLRSAMTTHGRRDLKGVTIVYLGPSSDREEITTLVRASGASLRYIVYPIQTP